MSEPWRSLRDGSISYRGEIVIEVDLLTGFYYVTVQDDGGGWPDAMREVAWSWPEAWGIATGFEWGVMDNCRWVVRLRTPPTVH
jgi:hypothetical protein